MIVLSMFVYVQLCGRRIRSYLRPVVLQRFLQLQLGGSGLLLVGLSQVFDG